MQSFYILMAEFQLGFTIAQKVSSRMTLIVFEIVQVLPTLLHYFHFFVFWSLSLPLPFPSLYKYK